MKKALFIIFLASSLFADPGNIFLAKGVIDPNAPEISASKAKTALLSNEGTCLYIVQPENNFSASETRAVEKLGIRFQGPIPPNAYLVEMRPDQKAALEEQFSILYCDEFLPEYKLLYTDLKPNEIQTLNQDDAHYVLIGAVRKSYLKDIKEAAAFIGVNDIEDAPGTLSPCIKCHLFDWQADELAKRGDIAFIEPYSDPEVCNDVAKGTRGVNAVEFQKKGYSGAGQKICIQDTGLDNGTTGNKLHPDFQGKKIKGSVTSVAAKYRSKKYRKSWTDFNGHGTHVAGSAAGNGRASSGTYRGVASSADIYSLCAGDSAGSSGIGPASAKELKRTYAAGCRVMNNSWGSTGYGKYNDASRLYDKLVWDNKDYTVLFAAGNANSYYDRGLPTESTLGYQAAAKNVITVGAAESYRPGNELSEPDDGVHQGMAYFSSRGPCVDGRIKPDVVAPGTRIISALASTEKTSSRSQYYTTMDGTSMATPIVSGCAAVIREYLQKNRGVKSPSAALVKCLLCTGARSLYPGQYSSFREIPRETPNAVEGHGHVDLKESLEPTEGQMQFFEDKFKKTGQKVEKTFNIPANKDITIGLCWSDYPGTAGSYYHLVNDLDLKVTAPNGNVYILSDNNINNLEVIRLSDPGAGNYKVTITARNIMKGPQPFAVVVNYHKAEESSSPIPLMWEGELPWYDVDTGEHNFNSDSQIYIDEFSIADTNIKGTISYQIYTLSGTYYSCGTSAFQGTYNKSTREISFNATKWIDDPSTGSRTFYLWSPKGVVSQDKKTMTINGLVFKAVKNTFKSHNIPIPTEKHEEENIPGGPKGECVAP